MPKRPYVPTLRRIEIAAHRAWRARRVRLYKDKGIDFAKIRRFMMKKIAPLRGTMLEIGAGSGYTTLALAKAGFTFISVDTDRKALKSAALALADERLLSRATFYVMDGKRLEFRARTFACVVAVNLFHHVRGMRGMLREMERVLRPGGKAVLMDFNRRGMAIMDAVHRHDGNPHEDSGVTERDVRAYFRRAGYRVERHGDRAHWGLICRKPERKSPGRRVQEEAAA